VTVAKALIRTGTNLNARRKEGSTLLHAVCYWGLPESCELLLKNGADPSIAASNGMNALHWAVTFNACEMMGGDERAMSVLRQGKEDCCRLLLKTRIDLEARDSMGYTALHWATEGSFLRHLPAGMNATVCRLLLDAGANVNATNNLGQTPLHRLLEAEPQSTNVYVLLVAKGADVNARDHELSTPLHLAVSGGKTNICAMLLADGADVRAKTKEGLTPIDVARAQGHGDVVSLLEQGNPAGTPRSKPGKMLK
jgi:ankyrin repeat protein